MPAKGAGGEGDRAYPSPELAAVLAAAIERERRMAPYLLTLVRAGLRPSEGVALQWDDLDLGARQLRVERSLGSDGRAAPTKTGDVRTVDVSPELARALLRVPREQKAETLKRGWAEDAAVDVRLGCRDSARPVERHEGMTPGTQEAPQPPPPRPLAHVRNDAPRPRGADHVRGGPDGHTRPTTTLAHYAHWLPRADARWEGPDVLSIIVRDQLSSEAGHHLGSRQDRTDVRR